MSNEVLITDFCDFLEKGGRKRSGNHAGKVWEILRRELGGESGSKTKDLKFDPEDVRKLLDRNKFGPGRSKGDERTRPNYVRNLGELAHGDLDDFLKERGF